MRDLEGNDYRSGNKKMKALIDADIICYEFGDMTELETGDLLPWEITRSLVDERINYILSAVDATTHELYLTGGGNFRIEAATILPYKGHRPSTKPPHYQAIRQHLIDNWDAIVVSGIEADDAVGIRQTEDTIICSRDKDLNMIPGHHFSWACGNQKERTWFTDETEAIRHFYKQLLTGDSTDNILGLYRVGEKSTAVKALLPMTEELDMFRHVFEEYSARFGAWALEAVLENATLLWILRDGDEDEAIKRILRLYDQAYGEASSVSDEDSTGWQEENES